MPKIEDFKLPNGQIDYKAYNAAYDRERQEQKDNGDICSRCGGFMLWKNGRPQKCAGCKAIEEPDELRHGSEIRCPKCGYAWRVGDGDYYELYEEGEHEVGCARCGHDFLVLTYVSHTFASPARLEESPKKES